MDLSDDWRWRMELEPDFRLQQIDRILVSLMIFFPNCASMEHLAELVRMAEWLEEDLFIEAKNYNDYMDRIYVRLLKMEIRFPNKAAGSYGMQSQMHNQGQQLLSQNDTIVSDGTTRPASLSPAVLPSMTKLTHTSVLNVVAGLQKKSGIAKKQFPSQELQHHQLMKQNLLQSTQMSNDVGRRSTNTQSETVGRKQQLMKQNLSQPTQMPNVVGRSTNTQSEIAHAQDLFQKMKQQHQLMDTQLFSSSMNSNAQTGQNADDWQEEIYQEMQAIKQKFLPYLKDLYQMKFKECEEHLKRNDSVSNVPQSERQKLLDLLESHMRILSVSKESVVPAMKDSLSNYEKQVIHVIQSNWPRELPVSAQQQIQQPGGLPLSTQPQPQPQQQQQQQQQQEEVNSQPNATNEIIDVITDSD